MSTDRIDVRPLGDAPDAAHGPEARTPAALAPQACPSPASSDTRTSRAWWRLIGRRPKTTALVLVMTAVVGLYGWAAYQRVAARRAVEAGEAQAALSRLEICLWLWPFSADAEVHWLAARAARLTGDFEAAEAHLKRCIRLEGGATQTIQLEFLLMRAQTGEEDEVAPALFAHVDNKHPESALILATLSRAYMNHLRYGPAYTCLTRWIDDLPEQAKPFHWRGWVRERINDPKGAMQDYQRALQLDPELVPVRLRVAEMFLEDKQPLDALPHLERLHQKYPDRADVLARLGQCRFLQGQSAEARRLLEAAVQKMPEDAALLVHLGRLEALDGQPIEAEKWLRRALKSDPADLEAQYALVSSLQLQGRSREAAALLNQYEKSKTLVDRANKLLRAEAEHPTGDANIAAEIGMTLLQVGQDRQGVYWLEQALLRDPEHQTTHKALADHFDRKGEKDKAAAHRRRLHEK